MSDQIGKNLLQRVGFGSVERRFDAMEGRVFASLDMYDAER